MAGKNFRAATYAASPRPYRTPLARWLPVSMIDFLGQVGLSKSEKTTLWVPGLLYSVRGRRVLHSPPADGGWGFIRLVGLAPCPSARPPLHLPSPRPRPSKSSHSAWPRPSRVACCGTAAPWRRYDFRLAGDAETLDVLFSKLKGLIEETALSDGTLLPVSAAPAQMRQGCTQSRCRCGRREPQSQ